MRMFAFSQKVNKQLPYNKQTAEKVNKLLTKNKQTTIYGRFSSKQVYFLQQNLCSRS